MNITLYTSESRGWADYGWLKTRYMFSFAGYHNPSRMHFGALRVLNDDWIDGGTGFDTHPHDNMEIVTLILQGELRHSDSMGHTEVLKPDEVQVMTAGTGIWHSERNNHKETPVKLFQVWVYPREENLTPRYDQKWFDPDERQGTWQTLVGPAGPDVLHINQDAWFSRAQLPAGTKLTYTVHGEKQGIFLMVVEGGIRIGDFELAKRDGAGIREMQEIELTAMKDSDVLVVEVPVD